MKNKLLFLIFFIVSPFVMYAQVGIGVEDPHPSAALEIVSKEKGLLISRMTLSEKNAIQNPAESLLIYQTDGAIGFYYFDGSFWVYLKNISQINADWNATSGFAQILNKPVIAKAGTSGDFNDLVNIPAIILAGDTSKMLLPYLTLDKIQPFFDGKASVADLNKEIARVIQLEQQLAANLQAEISRATKADSISKISMETVEQKLDTQVKVNSDKIDTNTTNINSLDAKVAANTSGIQTNATIIGQKESSANKSTDITLADGTDTKFPTEKAVKTYVDQAISNRGVGVPYTGATQTLNLGNNDLKTTSNITASGFLVPNATNSQFLKGDGTLDSKQYVEVKTNTVAIGTDAGKLGQQQNAIAIGAEAGSEIQNQNSIAIGAGAGRGLQEVGSIAIGYVAGDGGQGSHSIALGSNVAQGAQAAESVGIGYAAAQYNQGEKSVALGAFAGNNNQSNNAVAIGYNAQTAAPNSVALGSGAVANTSNTIQLGNSAVTAVKTAGKLTTGAITLPNLDGTSGQVLATNGAGLVSWITPSTATNGTFVDLISAQTVAGDKTFSSNIIVNGVSVGRGNGNNDESLAIGQGAMGVSNTNGKRNTAVGWGAMRSYVGTGFDNNTSLGYNNLPGLTTGSGNTSVGAESMMALTTGTENTSIGNQSLISTTGSNNVGVGKRSGQTITSGSQNTIIGTDADVSTATLTNATALGYGAIVTADNTVQLGSTSVTDVKTSGTITAAGLSISGSATANGTVTATSFTRTGGTSSEYLMADGSVSAIPTQTAGVWTITSSSITSGNISGFIFGNASGFYTKIGNIVSFSATITFKGSGSGSVPYIDIDLPFTSNFTSASDASGSVSGTNRLDSFGEIVSGYIEANNNNNKLRLFIMNNYGGNSVKDPTIGVSGMYIVR